MKFKFGLEGWLEQIQQTHLFVRLSETHVGKAMVLLQPTFLNWTMEKMLKTAGGKQCDNYFRLAAKFYTINYSK